MPGTESPAASGPALSAQDRAAIDDLLATYVLSLDVDDIEGAVNLFVEDGEFHLSGRALTGWSSTTTSSCTLVTGGSSAPAAAVS